MPKRYRSSSQPLSDLRLRRQKLIDEINRWHPPRCCKNKCHEIVGIETCREQREKFLRLFRDPRKELLRSFVVESEVEDAHFEVNGVHVCWNYVITSFDVSRSLISNVLGLPSANASPFPGRLGGSDMSITKKATIVSFMRILADEVADEIPNSLERHLPHGNKLLVYHLHEENQKKMGKATSSISYFYSVWKSYASHIKCRKSHGFSVCDTCTQFKEKLLSIARCAGHFREREVLRKGFSRHLQVMFLERSVYSHVQMMASERPSEILSVIIDGADQAEFALPRFPVKTKRESGVALKQKLTGVLFHGALANNDFLCFLTSADNIPAGANQTADALIRSIFILLERREASGMKSIPSVLYVQLDNTCKDNKNSYFFAFCEFLVHKGLFKQIVVNFLPVGHTHEDIDRKFSRVSVYLKDRATVTVSDLHEALKSSQSGINTPYVGRVRGMNNFSGALRNQNLVSKVPNMLTYFKFIFEAEESGSVGHTLVKSMASYKIRDSRDNWTCLSREEGSVGSFLRGVPDMSNAPPVEVKGFTEKELLEFKKRLRLSEGRIRSVQNNEELKQEIAKLERREVAQPDWKFEKLYRLAQQAVLARMRADNTESEEVASEGDEVGQGYTYDEGEMVAVNCGSDATTSNPFWLGRIERVISAARETKLIVRWFELYGRKPRVEPGYNGSYRQISPSALGTSTISTATVLVNFESLTSANKIPEFPKRLIKEALDPFGEES